MPNRDETAGGAASSGALFSPVPSATPSARLLAAALWPEGAEVQDPSVRLTLVGKTWRPYHFHLSPLCLLQSTFLPAMAHDYAAVLQPLTRHINSNDLLQLARGFSHTYEHLALSSPTHFLATPVTALPTGKETGAFLAIDVGGTNLRVGFVELLGEPGDDSLSAISRDQNGRKPSKIRRSHERAWPIEDHLKMDQADDLFLWIGDCIAGVVKDALNDVSLGVSHLDEIPMGITFSFPMK